MKNFLFDLYGTLVDIHTDEESVGFWESVAALLKTKDAEAVKNRYSELCAREVLSAGGEFDLSVVLRQLVKEFGVKTDPMRFARDFRLSSVRKLRLFDGAAEMLDGLHARGAKVYLLSNAQACFTRYEIEKLALAERFDGVLLSSEVGWKKPSEKFFRAAFETFSLLPDECVYIGNDLHDDVAGARCVGMRSVYIETEQSGKYAQEITPDFVAPDHERLAQLLYRLAEEV